MGLSTHVLDTMHGSPAAGMGVELYTTEGDQATLVKHFTLNADGRNPDGLLYDNASLKAGTYRLVFDVNDRPVQWLHGLYRPDRYEYQMDVSQVGSVDARISVKESLSE